MKIQNAVALVTGAEIVKRALDGLEAGLDEVLADEITRQVKQGMTAARPSYLPQASCGGPTLL